MPYMYEFIGTTRVTIKDHLLIINGGVCESKKKENKKK